MLKVTGNTDSPLAECVDELWASRMDIENTTNYADGTGFRFVSAPLTEISGRVTYLPAPRLDIGTPSNTMFGFGIWAVWISDSHGLVACNRKEAVLNSRRCSGDLFVSLALHSSLVWRLVLKRRTRHGR